MRQGLSLEEKDWSCEYVDSYKLTREQRKEFNERCKRRGVVPNDYMEEFFFKEDCIERQILAEKEAKKRSALLRDDDFLKFCKAVVDDIGGLDRAIRNLRKQMKQVKTVQSAYGYRTRVMTRRNGKEAGDDIATGAREDNRKAGRLHLNGADRR